MKLIQRMFIKQLLAVFIPCVVAVVFYFVTISLQINSDHKGINEQSDLGQTINRFQLYEQIKKRIDNQTGLPEDLLAKPIEASLMQVNSHLMIVDQEEVLYSSEALKGLNKDYVISQLQQQSTELKIGRSHFQIYTVESSEQNIKYLFLHEQAKRLGTTSIALIVAACAFLITYIICCLYINYRLNRKLIKPIMELKEAAVKISEGELDSIIAVDTQDEIEELSKSLEFLRVKLKETIRLQKRYDDNRSFLISSISHDLRTPVTTIKGYVEAIRDGIATTPERQTQYLTIIDKKANQINEMIEDLLLYSKLDLDQLPFTFTKVNIVKYLQDGIDEYSQFFKQHHVSVQLINSLEQHNSVLMDLNRFMRVIQNIWNNAVIYNNKAEKEIVINIRETYTTIVIEIKDNGKGIEQNEANQIFERFYRNDKARQSDQGSGLGLAIAKQIIEAHKGQIWAKGQLGIGTSIFISLPKIKE